MKVKRWTMVMMIINVLEKIRRKRKSKQRNKEVVNDLLLSDDDIDNRSNKRKTQQNNKAGVEVDDNFADETWDESSMEVSKE